MSYVTQSHANRPVAVIAVVGIHAALAAILATGLATTFNDEIFTGPLPTREYRDPPPPEPDEPKPRPRNEATSPPIYSCLNRDRRFRR